MYEYMKWMYLFPIRQPTHGRSCIGMIHSTVGRRLMVRLRDYETEQCAAEQAKKQEARSAPRLFSLVHPVPKRVNGAFFSTNTLRHSFLQSLHSRHHSERRTDSVFADMPSWSITGYEYDVCSFDLMLMMLMMLMMMLPHSSKRCTCTC